MDNQQTIIKYSEQTTKQRLQLAKFYAKHIDTRGYSWQYVVKYIINGEFILKSVEDVNYLCGYRGTFYKTNSEKYFQNN